MHAASIQDLDGVKDQNTAAYCLTFMFRKRPLPEEPNERCEMARKLIKFSVSLPSYVSSLESKDTAR